MSFLDYDMDTFFPIHGDQSSFNIKTLLRNAIVDAPYFKELCILNSFQDVIILI
jgi:hypothetical protein